MTVTTNRTDRNAMDQTIDGHVQATRGAGVDSRLCSKGREFGGGGDACFGARISGRFWLL